MRGLLRHIVALLAVLALVGAPMPALAGPCHRCACHGASPCCCGRTPGHESPAQGPSRPTCPQGLAPCTPPAAAPEAPSPQALLAPTTAVRPVDRVVEVSPVRPPVLHFRRTDLPPPPGPRSDDRLARFETILPPPGTGA